MKNKNLWLISHAFVIMIMLICNFNNGAKLFAQETENSFDIDNDGFFETIDFEAQQNLQDYSMLLDTGDIVHIIDAPAENSQGLTWDGNYLWVSDISTSMIYKVDPSDGSVIISFDAPGASTEGLAWDGTNLWATDNGGGPLNPQALFKMNPNDGTIISSVELESMSWAHGITWDGEYIWVDNFGPKTITKVNQATGEVLHTIPTPATACIGISWNGNNLWADDFQTDSLYLLNPGDGSVIYRIPAPYSNARDLAWDGQYLWVLAAQAMKIYQVDVGYITAVNKPQVENNILGEISIYPNPFKKKLNIDYNIDIDMQISVTILNQHGKLITTLFDQFQKKGEKTLYWDGTNSAGYQMPAGIYFCRFISTSIVHTEKIFLSR